MGDIVQIATIAISRHDVDLHNNAGKVTMPLNGLFLKCFQELIALGSSLCNNNEWRAPRTFLYDVKKRDIYTSKNFTQSQKRL